MSVRRPDERGSVVLFVAILSIVLLGAAAFTVDLGMQRVVRSDMQSTADTASLDMARALDTGITPGSQAWRDALEASVAGDPSTLGHAATTTPAGWSSAYSFCNTKLCAQATPGYLDADSQFTTTAPSGATGYSAVRVNSTAEVARGLARVFGAGDLPATRSAVATTTPPNSCYKVSSFALGVDTTNSILGPLLGLAGANQALTLLSSSGVATAAVSLLALATQLGVGTPEQLVTMPSLTMGGFLLAAATVLDDQSNTVQAAALRDLKVALGSVAGEQMNLADLLDLGQGNASAVDANVSVGDLINGALLVADGSSAIYIPGLSVNLSPLGAVTATARIVQPPVIGCNGGIAKAAQVTIELKNTSDSVTVAGLATVQNLDVTVSLANAWASSATADPCSTSSMELNVSNQTLANVRLTADVYALFGLLKVATIDTGAPQTLANQAYVLPIPGSYTVPVPTGSGTVGLDLSNASVDVLGVLDVGALLSGLSPLLDSITGLLTGTLLPALGITTAGADLYAIAPTPTCGGPKLVG